MKFKILKEKTYDGIPLTKEFVLLDIKGLFNNLNTCETYEYCSSSCSLYRGTCACAFRDLADCTDIYSENADCPINDYRYCGRDESENIAYLKNFLKPSKESIE